VVKEWIANIKKLGVLKYLEPPRKKENNMAGTYYYPPQYFIHYGELFNPYPMINSGWSYQAPNTGWICPKCGCVYSPSTIECWRCNQSKKDNP